MSESGSISKLSDETKSGLKTYGGIAATGGAVFLGPRAVKAAPKVARALKHPRDTMKIHQMEQGLKGAPKMADTHLHPGGGKHRGTPKPNESYSGTMGRHEAFDFGKSLSGHDAFWGEVVKRDFSVKSRKKLAAKGDALPDGSFPIKSKKDLANAERLEGKSKHPAEVAAFIEAKKKELSKAMNGHDAFWGEEISKGILGDIGGAVKGLDAVGAVKNIKPALKMGMSSLKPLARKIYPAEGGGDAMEMGANALHRGAVKTAAVAGGIGGAYHLGHRNRT